MMKKQFQPAEWQKNPDNVTTETVQYWSWGGSMLTAQMSNAVAREHIRAGRAFVITGQAIGALK